MHTYLLYIDILNSISACHDTILTSTFSRNLLLLFVNTRGKYAGGRNVTRISMTSFISSIAVQMEYEKFSIIEQAEGILIHNQIVN